MASAFKVVASKLLTRPVVPFRPAVAAHGLACRSFSTNNYGVLDHDSKATVVPFRSAVVARGLACRSFSTNNNGVPDHDSKTKDDLDVFRHKLYDVINRFKITRKLSRLFQRINYFPAKVIKPTSSKENHEFLWYYIHMNGVSQEDVKVFVFHNSLLIEGEANDDFKATRGFKKYVCWIDLPDVDLADKKYKIRDIKADMKNTDGVLKLTIPKFKDEELMFSVKVNTTVLVNGR